MDYCLKAGMLYAAGQEEPLASIRAVLGAQTRKIFAPDGVYWPILKFGFVQN